MSLRVDSASTGMRVCDVCFHLDAGRQGPSLGDWLPPEQLREVERRCQNLMNTNAYGCEVEEADSDLGALELRCNGDGFLAAASAVMTVAGPGPGQGGGGNSDPELIAFIRMRGLSKLWVPWAGCVHGSRRNRQPVVSGRLQPIDELS